MSSDSLGFIYPQGSDLVEPVNQVLAEMKASGELEELAEKIRLIMGDEFRVLVIPNAVDIGVFSPKPPDHHLRDQLVYVAR